MRAGNFRFVFKVMTLLCFVPVSLTAQQLDLQWVVPFSGNGGTIVVSSITVDEGGNVFAVGSFKDSIVANTVNGIAKVISKGNEDMFVSKINASGSIEWIKQVGGKANLGNTGAGDLSLNYYFSIVSDKNGNLYIAGNYKDTVDFDPGSNSVVLTTGSYLGSAFPGQTPPTLFYENGFVLKLDKNGEFRWVRNLPGKSNAISGIALDANEGTIAIAGYYKDSVDFNAQQGGNVLISPFNSRKTAFVAKYDLDGQFRWVRQMGGGSIGAEAVDISINNQGYVFTTGLFSDSSDFDPGAGVSILYSTAKPGQNMFVSKLDANGDHVWAKAMGSISTGSGARGSAIATDNSGNVITVGYFQILGGFDPTNGTTIPATPNLSLFVSKLDSTGNYVWAKSLDRPGQSGVDHGTTVAIDKKDAIYVGGYFARDIYFDPNQSNPNRHVFTSGTTSPDAMLFKLDSSGNYEWGRSVTSNKQSRGFHVFTSTNKEVYLSGSFSGSTEFNPLGASNIITAAHATNFDGFVMKLYCTDTSSSQVVLKECGNSLKYNDVMYNASGIYTQILSNAAGCDSILTLDLTLYPVVPVTITVSGFKLGTGVPYKTYQWFLDDQAISGATDSIYVVDKNGKYKVVVTTANNCFDTSIAYEISNVSVGNSPLSDRLIIYPNPVLDRIYITPSLQFNIQITSVDGKLLRSETATNSISVQELSVGLYFIRIIDIEGNIVKVQKFIKATK